MDTGRHLYASGVGVDLVHIPSFVEQLEQEGTVFSRVFTDREWAYCQHRSSDCFAVRWAAKEAMVKAWSTLILGHAPMIDPSDLDWSDIEVAHDQWQRPYLRFHGRVAQELTALERRLGASLRWTVSLSHDGDMAIAYVQVLALTLM